VFALFKPMIELDWLDSPSQLIVYLRGQSRWRGRGQVRRGLREVGKQTEAYPTLHRWLNDPFRVLGIDTPALKADLVSFLTTKFKTHPDNPWQTDSVQQTAEPK
jgi:hypothetical protein